ncbi:PadR family transcriptional regulator [Rhodococcus oryzae]|uniref:PadR family transcriptional regulator n=1 Tax=Rhodococcus oryzae TaxID=2571143 RepID=A0ABY2RM03_9NOCA|nr:PadR family transcriptional regulator [Rhodococcus oryzae]TJZ78282.1 PadR family transcriptional regulator [Rhodococcus oryzae]
MEHIQREHEHGRGRRRPGREGRDRRRDGFGPGFGPGMAFGPGHGPGGQRLGRGRGRGGRGRRGDVRAAVLLLLAEGPMHGYELIQRIVERSNGVWRPSPGSIYPALAQLEDEGLVLIEKVAGRKTARLTESGVAYVEENKADLGNPWDEVSAGVGQEAQDLRGLIGQLMGAAGQVAAVGTPEQIRKAGEVLTESRRALYRILADDPNPTSNPPGSDETESESDE